MNLSKGGGILSENIKQEIVKINVISKAQLDELYKGSALTFEGFSADDENIDKFVKWLKEHSEISNPLPIHIISGQTMNINYGLTGSNKYKDDLTIVSIKNEDIKDLSAFIIPRLKFGGRWFDDIVDNNATVEESKPKEKTKPKCALIGKNGNIFNLMGIAARTLKQNDMREQAKEMIERITSSKSYDEALNIIEEYVEITDEEEAREEEEWE